MPSPTHAKKNLRQEQKSISISADAGATNFAISGNFRSHTINAGQYFRNSTETPGNISAT